MARVEVCQLVDGVMAVTLLVSTLQVVKRPGVLLKHLLVAGRWVSISTEAGHYALVEPRAPWTIRNPALAT